MTRDPDPIPGRDCIYLVLALNSVCRFETHEADGA